MPHFIVQYSIGSGQMPLLLPLLAFSQILDGLEISKGQVGEGEETVRNLPLCCI